MKCLKNKKIIRMVVDISMTVLMPMLMAYSLIGEKSHEIMGAAIFALFILHHILNMGWYHALYKGRYNAVRIFRTVINTLLLVIFLAQCISGILMSRYILTSVTIAGVSASARQIHMLFAYWGFVLMCIHAGMHLSAPLTKLFNRKKKIWTVCIVLMTAASGYGIYAFKKRMFPDYMLMKVQFAFFDYNEAVILFLLDYIAIMALFISLGAAVVRLMKPSAAKPV